MASVHIPAARGLMAIIWFARALALVLAVNAVAHAQDASQYYTVRHPEKFKTDWAGFYRQADASTAAVRSELPHKLDLQYGANVKQRLDLYFPKKAPSGAPVFMFLHGGGFREGDRAQYGFVARPFALGGIIVAVASYRLTGEGFKYPSQLEDAQLAVEWLYHNIKQYGGNPTHIFVGGHSSGAILAADIAVNRSWLERAGVPKQTLRGIAPVSGPYDLRTPGNPSEEKVFWSGYVPTPELRAQASPMLHIVDPPAAAVVAAGSTEIEGYDNYVASSKEFVAKLLAHGTRAQFLSLSGAGHKDTVLALGDEKSELSQVLVQLINAP
jgi:acetyl esterase/lipase